MDEIEKRFATELEAFDRHVLELKKQSEKSEDNAILEKSFEKIQFHRDNILSIIKEIEEKKLLPSSEISLLLKEKIK